MDSLFARARALAEQTAQRSQQLISDTALYSEQVARDAALKSSELGRHAAARTRELAEATARHSRVIAEEASRRSIFIAQEAAKKADIGYKTIVKELALGGAQVKGKNREENREEYGITPELKEYVQSLTVDTFKKFPVDVEDVDSGSSNNLIAEVREAGPQVSQELTDWQVHHATLVLNLVPEISTFRYDLCPRFMKEHRFWRIYFALVKSHVSRYEATFNERKSQATTVESMPKEQDAPVVPVVDTPPAPAGHSADVDRDLDAYLLGALGEGESGEGEEEDGDFDPEDFDQFVNEVVLDKAKGLPAVEGNPEASVSEEEDEGVLVHAEVDSGEKEKEK